MADIRVEGDVATITEYHNAQVDRILRHLRQGLAPFVLRAFKRHDPDGYLLDIRDALSSDTWQTQPFQNDRHALDELDLYALLKLMRRRRNMVFQNLRRDIWPQVNVLWDARNDRAHETDANSFDEKRMHVIANAAIQLLHAVGDFESTKRIRYDLARQEALQAQDSAPGRSSLASPSVTAISAGEATIRLAWDAVEGAKWYDIRYRVHSRTAFRSTRVSSPAHILEGLDPGTKYVVQLCAFPAPDDEQFDSSQWGEFSIETASPRRVVVEETQTHVPLDIPTGISKPCVDQISLTWKAVQRADCYEVRYRKAGATAFGPAVTVSFTTWTIRNLEAGKTYAIQLRALPASHDVQYKAGPWHSISVATRAAAKPVSRQAGGAGPGAATGAPAGREARQPAWPSLPNVPDLSGRLTPTGIQLIWSPVKGATGYELNFRAPGSASYQTIKTNASTFTKLLPGWRRLEIRARAILATANAPYRKGEWSERRILGQ